jgi:hypothetical protein
MIVSDLSLPQARAQTGTPELRGSPYGDQYVNQLTLDRMALQGSLFRAMNATIGTGIAQTANTTQDTTKPFITGANPAASTKRVRLVSLIMKPTAVSSSQTTQRIDVVTCAGVAYASAGTDYLTLASGLNGVTGYSNVGRAAQNNASVLSVLRVGVPVTVLGSEARLQAHFSPRVTTIPVVQDEYVMTFGDLGAASVPGTGIVPVGTTVDRIVKACGPVIVDPGYSFLIIPWAASIAGAMSWEFELTWTEE